MSFLINITLCSCSLDFLPDEVNFGASINSNLFEVFSGTFIQFENILAQFILLLKFKLN